jgi:hypothetical protein
MRGSLEEHFAARGPGPAGPLQFIHNTVVYRVCCTDTHDVKTRDHRLIRFDHNNALFEEQHKLSSHERSQSWRGIGSRAELLLVTEKLGTYCARALTAPCEHWTYTHLRRVLDNWYLIVAGNMYH